MASNARNVYAGEPLATGTLIVYPLGTPLPATGADGPPPTGGVDLGHIGEDGFTETSDRNPEKIRNWGGKVVKVLNTEYTLTVKFTLLESLSANVRRVAYGDNNVTVEDGTIIVRKNSARLPKKSYLIDSWDSELEAYYRHWVPVGQITELGDVQTVHKDVIKFECTMEAFEDDDGNNMYTFIKASDLEAVGDYGTNG